MKKLAIVVGHNSVSQGAIRIDTQETEFVWNSRLAKLLKANGEAFGLDIKIFHRIAGGGYAREIARVYDEVDRFKPEASIELHFNGSDNPSASGSEVLSSGTALSLRLAAAVQREIVASLGLRDRGVKTIGGKSRGGKSLYSGKAPAILIEPFFGSSVRGTAATDTDAEIKGLALAVLSGASEAIGAYPRKDITESRTLQATARQKTAIGGAVTAIGGVGFMQVINSILSSPSASAELVVALQPLTSVFPELSGILSAVSAALMIYSNMQAKNVDAARIEDFGKERR
ncbi:N-acetylmuramoyl-L-alanine amidase [uncultured Pelagimonas sp.]|uniref:N-acetylmuramoyl-L-alanine amidase n=1 Tax=uncultured Pelagimonas sp. TaxID=1618102 RepID=UPI002605926B|nr:N-acetylmuramoyl-L-alanine amidase [uncultured Pelagimonas sp.]